MGIEHALLGLLGSLGGGAILYLRTQLMQSRRAYAELVAIVLENAELSKETRRELARMLKKGEL